MFEPPAAWNSCLSTAHELLSAEPLLATKLGMNIWPRSPFFGFLRGDMRCVLINLRSCGFVSKTRASFRGLVDLFGIVLKQPCHWTDIVSHGGSGLHEVALAPGGHQVAVVTNAEREAAAARLARKGHTLQEAVGRWGAGLAPE